MPKCPFCDNELSNQAKQDPEAWLCACGEMVPFGFEVDSSENCETCPVMYCPKRKRPFPDELKAIQV